MGAKGHEVQPRGGRQLLSRDGLDKLERYSRDTRIGVAGVDTRDRNNSPKWRRRSQSLGESGR